MLKGVTVMSSKPIIGKIKYSQLDEKSLLTRIPDKEETARMINQAIHSIEIDSLELLDPLLQRVEEERIARQAAIFEETQARLSAMDALSQTIQTEKSIIMETIETLEGTINSRFHEEKISRQSAISSLQGSLNSLTTTVNNKADRQGSSLVDFKTRNLTVAGDLTISGESFVMDTESLRIQDPILRLNEGEIGDGVTEGLAGIRIERGTKAPYYMVFNEQVKRFQVGKENALTTLLADADLEDLFNEKVDKVPGKGLSSEDFTSQEKTKLSGIETGAEVNRVYAVAGKTGSVLLNNADVGLGNVENIRQATKQEFDSHRTHYTNPHQVTKSQVGLGLVANYSLATESESEAGELDNRYMTPYGVKRAINAQAGVWIGDHISETNNPHAITKAQIGLGQVDNYSKSDYDTFYADIAHTHSLSSLDAASKMRTIFAGNGLVGGGTLQDDRTLSLGTPGTITMSSENSSTANTHSHALDLSKEDLGLGDVPDLDFRTFGLGTDSAPDFEGKTKTGFYTKDQKTGMVLIGTPSGERVGLAIQTKDPTQKKILSLHHTWEGLWQAPLRVYHEGDKPTKDDVGLSEVENKKQLGYNEVAQDSYKLGGKSLENIIIDLTSADVGLPLVENKSSAMIRAEITAENITTALTYTPEDAAKRGVPEGYASLSESGKIPLSQLPDIVKQKTYVVNDNIEREALQGLIEGEKAFELDTKNTYIWDGIKWIPLSRSEWENVEIEWESILNKPATFTPKDHLHHADAIHEGVLSIARTPHSDSYTNNSSLTLATSKALFDAHQKILSSESAITDIEDTLLLKANKAGDTFTGTVTIDGTGSLLTLKELEKTASLLFSTGKLSFQSTGVSAYQFDAPLMTNEHLIYHEGHKPSKADVGLDRVSNYSRADYDERYAPIVHGHDQLHTHGNSALLDTLTDLKLAEWDSKAEGDHDHDAAYEPKNPQIALHIASIENPHNVTKTQLNLNHVRNVIQYSQSEVDQKLLTKVDKVLGKGLSTNDFDDLYKTKLETLEYHPETHPASMIVESTERQFVSDADITRWDEKQSTLTEMDDIQIKGLTVHGDILPAAPGINIGSATQKFDSIWAKEIHLDENTLYIGDTPILGTEMNTIMIQADPGQSINMSTRGLGQTYVTSESGVELSTTGTLADVRLVADGEGSRVALAAKAEIAMVAPNISASNNVHVGGKLDVQELKVRGDATILGDSFIVNAATVEVEDNIILLNKGEVGNGVTKGQAGLRIDRGDAIDYFMVFDETDRLFKVGKHHDLQAVASRNWTQERLDLKVGKQEGYGLSKNNLTDFLYQKLLGIEAEANRYIHPESHPASMITQSEARQFVTSIQKTEWGNAYAHISLTNNPHGVTKTQIGLGNVDDKSSATIRSELTNTNVTDALGYTPATDTHTHGQLHTHDNKTTLDGITSTNVNEWDNAYQHSLSSHLTLGETLTTAHRGDHGAAAYLHAESPHAPSDANFYAHPTDGGGTRQNLAEGHVISGITVNTEGHVTGTTTRVLTPGDIGAELADVRIQQHLGLTDNPHTVTKTQIGLGDVRNEDIRTYGLGETSFDVSLALLSAGIGAGFYGLSATEGAIVGATMDGNQFALSMDQPPFDAPLKILAHRTKAHQWQDPIEIYHKDAPPTANEVGAEPAFQKNTAFNKNFGPANDEVARGDHTHQAHEVQGLATVATTGSYEDLTETPEIPVIETYTHKQTTPATLWRVEHGLGRFPSVTIVDSGGSMVIGEVCYLDESVIEISFASGFSGKAYLN